MTKREEWQWEVEKARAAEEGGEFIRAGQLRSIATVLYWQMLEEEKEN